MVLKRFVIKFIDVAFYKNRVIEIYILHKIIRVGKPNSKGEQTLSLHNNVAAAKP